MHTHGTTIALIQPDLSKSKYLEQSIENSFVHVVGEFDDYIDFLCRFVSYTHSEINKSFGQEYAFTKIKQSIDDGKAVIIQFEADEIWSVIVGYDESNQSIYVLKWDTTVLVRDSFQESTDCIDNWYDKMLRYISLDKKHNYKLSYNDVFARLYQLMKKDYDEGNFQNSIAYLLNDNNFIYLDYESLIKEHKKINNFSFGRVINRCVADWYFNNPYELYGTDWGSRFENEFKQIAFACAVNHDLGHVNGSVLENYDNPDKSMQQIINDLKNRTTRLVLANTLYVAFLQNCKIMSLLKQISE